MKTKIILETAKELISAFNRTRPKGDESPMLPENAKIIFENNCSDVHLEASGFELDLSVMASDVIIAMADAASINIIIT
jgi:hypothetical protein